MIKSNFSARIECMRSRLVYIFKLFVTVSGVVLFLTSCGPQITVNLAESALAWRVDDFFDIDQKQRQAVKKDFRLFLNEIHEAEIQKAKAIIFETPWKTQTCLEVEQHYKILSALFEQGQKKLIKRSESFIATIEPNQVKYFISAFSKELKEDENKITNRSDRIERRQAQTLKTWNELFDDTLSAEQVMQLKNYVETAPDLSKLNLENRKKVLGEIEAANQIGLKEVRNYFTRYLQDRPSFQTPELRMASAARRKNAEAFFLKFVCEAKPEQKIALQNTVKEYLDTVEKVYIKP